MGAPRRHPANRRLTWARLQRGWSHDELAVQVSASMKAHGEPETGLIGNTVRRWETGERWPEPRFRKHLVLVFDQPADELGLLTADELAARPDDIPEPDPWRRLIAMATSPKDDPRLSRQAFLRLLLSLRLLPELAPLGALVNATEALTATADRGSRAGQSSAAAYAVITDTQRQLYWSSPARSLFDASLAHTQLGLQLLRTTGEGPTRRQLAEATSRSALLAGRLAFFDLGQVAMAKRGFDLAQQLAHEAEDHALSAVVYGHLAFVPGFAADQPAALTMLDVAHRHASYAAGPRLRSWLHCVEAEITARTGAPKQSLAQVRQAEDALATEGTDPAWLDFYDPSRLVGFAGYVQLAAGHHADATVSLEGALARLAPSAAKQRSVFLLDLATAYTRLDPQHAVELAGQALDTLQQDAYAVARDRLPALRAGLQGTRYAAELEERAALAL